MGRSNHNHVSKANANIHYSVSYFVTSIPGSGIFLPAHRALKQNVPVQTPNAQPTTPTNPSYFDLNRTPATKNTSPGTPSVPKFSQSMGPGARNPFGQSVSLAGRPSPAIKPKSRPSLPRPESPTRRPALPTSQSSTTANGRTSALGFNSSVRGGRPPVVSSPAPKRTAQPSTPVRPLSRSASRLAARSPPNHQDTPTVSRTVNGLRTATKATAPPSVELRRLQQELAERDLQLQVQAIALAEMEASLAEVQSIQASAETQSMKVANGADVEGSADLRAALREKNEKIAVLTAEFDQHRSDFRSTIDTLEMASTETEKVYEKRVEELQTEVREQQREIVELRENLVDVDIVGQQFKQLEELVQELEEGLEDARRGEAEARSEVEHLRGEVERTKSELQHEKERVGSRTPALDTNVMEQKDAEIRDLKATIQELKSASRQQDATASQYLIEQLESLEADLQDLSKQNTELKSELASASTRETNLTSELTHIRQQQDASHLATKPTHETPQQQPRATSPTRRPIPIIPPTANNASPVIPFSSGGSSPMRFGLGLGLSGMRSGLHTSSPRPNSSDGGGFPNSPSRTTHAHVAQGNVKYCDICDEETHDTTQCRHYSAREDGESGLDGIDAEFDDDDGGEEEAVSQSHERDLHYDQDQSATGSAEEGAGREEPVYDATGTGPAPGKRTKRIDMTKWCALCERDGHESVDCPFEEEW